MKCGRAAPVTSRVWLMASWALATLLLTGCVRQSVHTTTGEEQEPVFTNSIDRKLVLVPTGKFVMDSPDFYRTTNDSQPQHRVRITQPFYMCDYEVTQEKYERIRVRWQCMIRFPQLEQPCQVLAAVNVFGGGILPP